MTHRLLERPLYSNGFKLTVETGWLEPSSLSEPVEQLRQKYRQHGYLWLKGLLEPERVLAFREYYFSAFKDTGLLRPGSAVVDGIYSGHIEDPVMAHRIAVEIVRSEVYNQFCHSAPIVHFFENFLDGAVYLHRRKLIRYTLPGDPSCTGAHYDLTYLRGGTDRLCSMWIPVGDIPVEMGGLVYLEGSDALGRGLEDMYRADTANLPEEDRISAYKYSLKNGWLGEDLNTLSQKYGARWLLADYQAGDVVIHSPYMIHASTTNEDRQGRMRLSTDIRYQLASDKIDTRWTQDWSPDDKL
ncbi:MAG TPA: phytanoyl-CoA dioxygenase family protein [Chloroflexia bacterium]|nr:phytanoyl-CoA dioxygenase family protein [Chloroflexia bacterium]